ncbi:MAG: lipopolysaccharide biosynthesis protein [Anaeromyxobacteraceae bacterium]
MLPSGDPDADYFPLDADPARGSGRAGAGEWLVLVANATWRRRWIFLGTLVAGLALVTAYYLGAPRLYRSEAIVRAQRQQALPSLVRQGASDDAPTRSAYELIHSRENLLDLLRGAGLLSEDKREPPGLLERALLAFGFGPAMPDEDPNAPLVRKLDKALEVTTGEGTVKIALDWPDAHQAYVLVGAAAQSFLEARYLQDVTTIDDSIALLKGRLGPLREQLDEAIDDAQRRGAAMAELMPPPVPATATPSAQANDSLRQLESAIEAKTRAIRDIEDFRRRRLLELQAQIEERRGQFADAHPVMVGLRAEVAGLQQESRQVEVLREEEKKLRAEYASRYAALTPSHSRASSLGVRVASSAAVEQSERVRDARFQYQQMVSKVSAAQTDLDNARAAFKYRYSVIWPATVPTTPVSPKPVKVFGIGAVLSLLLAAMVAAAPDLLRRRVVERWQVERGLGIEVLATLRRH